VTPWAREIAESRGVRIVQVSRDQEPQVVAIGGDHGGYALKEQLKGELTRLGFRYLDMGTYSTDPVDYPDIALAVARAVRSGERASGSWWTARASAPRWPPTRSPACVPRCASTSRPRATRASTTTPT
jgi:hypothetical protein